MPLATVVIGLRRVEDEDPVAVAQAPEIQAAHHPRRSKQSLAHEHEDDARTRSRR